MLPHKLYHRRRASSPGKIAQRRQLPNCRDFAFVAQLLEFEININIKTPSAKEFRVVSPNYPLKIDLRFRSFLLHSPSKHDPGRQGIAD
jgi:hypothetical protein